MTKRKILEYGGVAAGVVMIAIGIVSLVLAINGRNEVRSSLKQEAIVGSPDMTPDAIAAEAKEAGLPASIKLPTCSVADQAIDTGSEAKCFAQYMRIHGSRAPAASRTPRWAGSSPPPTPMIPLGRATRQPQRRTTTVSRSRTAPGISG